MVLPKSALEGFNRYHWRWMRWNQTMYSRRDLPKWEYQSAADDILVLRATVKMIGIIKITPTSKKTGIPTINPTIIIAQCTRFHQTRSTNGSSNALSTAGFGHHLTKHRTETDNNGDGFK